MKRIIAYNITIFVIGLIISVGPVNAENKAEPFSPVDNNEIPQILNMISDKTQDNYKHIKTWEGEVESTIDYIYEGVTAEKVFRTHTDGSGEIPKMVMNSTEGKIQYALNTEKDFLYVNRYSEKPLQYIDLETGRNLGAKGIPDRNRLIITPEYYIQCRPNTTREGTVLNRKVVKEFRQKGTKCAAPLAFDPRSCFYIGAPIWETFPKVVQHIREHGEFNVDGYNLKVEKRTDGNTMEYRVILPGRISSESYLFSAIVFSSEQGFNITSFEMTDQSGKLFQKWTQDYELINGIYLPTEITEQHFEGPDGKLSYGRRSTLKTSQINQIISPETFTYKNLGLKDGDKFIDKIEGKEYKYQDANLVPIAEPNNPP